jgi:PAS domain S-box-containing protein
VRDPALELLDDPALLVDARTRAVVAANDAARRRLGHDPAGADVRTTALVEPRAAFVDALALAERGDAASVVEGTFAPAGFDPLAARVHVARARDGSLLVVARDARGTRDAEEELRRTATFLEAIVENVPDMIFVKRASDHMFVKFNRAGEELLGWTRSQLLGKTDHDFYPKEQADFFHLKDKETLRSKLLVDVPEEPIQTKHKGERILHTKKIPVLDAQGEPLYLLGISEDITARLAGERSARELAQVARHAHDAIVAWQLDGTIVSWNPAAERLYGRAEAQAVGRRIEELVPPMLAPAFRARQDELLRGQRVPPEVVVRLRADGREVEVEENAFVIRDGAGKPVRLACIARDVTEVIRLRRVTEILQGLDAAPQPDDETSRSSAMREAISAAELVADDATATVLLLGETGVGKSWLARRIHARSPRAKKPFFEVNCAGLSEQLLESELFGHERGAFTGATQQKRGLVETAEGGTLFLDEVGELSASAQGQLLTFLDSKKFRRVGGNRLLTADVRLVAATNVDLRQAAEEGRFRRDLYYRLSVVPVTIPPLRERAEDIPAMARTLLAELMRRASDGRTSTLDPAVLPALTRYAWPGNIRELKNALERALILARGGTIRLEHLPHELRQEPARVPTSAAKLVTLEELEREHILRVLEATGGNRTAAAEVLGISRSTLKRKLAAFRPDLATD